MSVSGWDAWILYPSVTCSVIEGLLFLLILHSQSFKLNSHLQSRT